MNYFLGLFHSTALSKLQEIFCGTPNLLFTQIYYYTFPSYFHSFILISCLLLSSSNSKHFFCILNSLLLTIRQKTGVMGVTKKLKSRTRRQNKVNKNKALTRSKVDEQKTQNPQWHVNSKNQRILQRNYSKGQKETRVIYTHRHTECARQKWKLVGKRIS